MNNNKDKYTHGRTSVYNLNYHIVFGTKYRNKWMTSELEEEIKDIFRRIAEENGFSIEHMEIGKDDHVHLLVSAPPKISVTVIVSCLKGTSSFRLFRLHPELKEYYWLKQGDRHLWSPSYFVESIGTTNQAAVAKYIDEQRIKEKRLEERLKSKQSN